METNVYYVSLSDDDFLEFYAKSKEQCCFDCNKLSMCLSWSYNVMNKTCILKNTFRSNPTLRENFYSGFKPNGLFSLTIIKGLEFKNVNNPIFLFLNKPVESLNSTEKGLYEFLKLDISDQVGIYSLISSNLISNCIYLFLFFKAYKIHK